jgi:hypothetical protein
MSELTPGYNRAVASLITGIVSILLAPLCGLGILTAVVGFIVGIGARRAATQGNGPRGLATAGIVVNGVVVTLTTLLIAVFGIASLGIVAAVREMARRDGGASPAISAAANPSSEPHGGPAVTLAEPSPTVMAVGDTVRLGDLALGVLAYSEIKECPGGGGHPSDGAKFILAQASFRNDSSEPTTLPSIRWTLGKYDEGLGAGHQCGYNAKALENACRVSGGRLFPDAHCEGWLLFEVPARTAVEAEAFTARLDSLPSGRPTTVSWRARP